MLDKQKVLDRANELYNARKREAHIKACVRYGDKPEDVAADYDKRQPAQMRTDSAHCIIEALVEAFNSRVY